MFEMKVNVGEKINAATSCICDKTSDEIFQLATDEREFRTVSEQNRIRYNHCTLINPSYIRKYH